VLIRGSNSSVAVNGYPFRRRGCSFYKLPPGIREAQAGPLIEKFCEPMREHAVFRWAFGLFEC